MANGYQFTDEERAANELLSILRQRLLEAEHQKRYHITQAKHWAQNISDLERKIAVLENE